MEFTLFSDIFDKIDSAIITVISSKTANLMNILSPVFLAAFIVYVIFITWSYFGSTVEQTMFDLSKRILAWGIIISFSINIGFYTSNVLPIVLGLGDGLSQAFNGTGTSTTVDSSLNSLAMSIVNSIADTWDAATGIEGTITAACTIVIIIIASVPFFVIAAAYILLAKVFIAILAVVGPVFIALALFPATRQFFSAWVNQVVNYSLLLLLMSITSSVFIAFIQETFGTGLYDVPRAFNLAVGCGMFLIILLKLPELASGLAGGITISGFAQLARAAMAVKTGGASLLGGKGGGGGGGGGEKSGGSVKPESQGK